MKILIPVTQHDVHRLPYMVKALIHFGGLMDHSVVFVATPSCVIDAQNAADELRSHCLEVLVKQTTYEYTFGLYADVNMLFGFAVRMLAQIGNKDPFLWMELDARPIDYGWANTLLREYKQKGRACLGNVVDLPRVRGEMLEPITGDRMMMAVGIYPPGLERHEQTQPLINDLGKPPPRNPEAPFDVYMRGALHLIGVANTNLISDQWNTGNYRKTNDGITCEPLPFHRIVRNRGGLVNKEAVLIHGCKDDSLDELLFGNSHPIVTATSNVAPAGVIAGGMSPSSPTEVLTSGAPSLKEDIEARLAQGSLRLNMLATAYKMDNKTMEQRVVEAGFVVTKPALWIKPSSN